MQRLTGPPQPTKGERQPLGGPLRQVPLHHRHGHLREPLHLCEPQVHGQGQHTQQSMAQVHTGTADTWGDACHWGPTVTAATVTAATGATGAGQPKAGAQAVIQATAVLGDMDEKGQGVTDAAGDTGGLTYRSIEVERAVRDMW
jgi:hypothetical protein